MTIEGWVRHKHDFEDSVRSFLLLASAMEDREIEIAIARIADRAANARDDSKHRHLEIKARILASYLQCRREGFFRRKNLLRASHRRKVKPFFEKLGIEEHFHAVRREKVERERILREHEARRLEVDDANKTNQIVYKAQLNDYEYLYLDYVGRLEDWKQSMKRFSAFQRLFSIGTPEKPSAPIRPSAPEKSEYPPIKFPDPVPHVEVFIQRSKEKAQLPEYFIENAARYVLKSVPDYGVFDEVYRAATEAHYIRRLMT